MTTLVTLLILLSCLQQQNTRRIPDLTGTWMLDDSQSEPPRRILGDKSKASTLAISQSETVIVITRQVEGHSKELRYYLDGRGESNPTQFVTVSFFEGWPNPYRDSPTELLSKTKWEGSKLKSAY